MPLHPFCIIWALFVIFIYCFMYSTFCSVFKLFILGSFLFILFNWALAIGNTGEDGDGDDLVFLNELLLSFIFLVIYFCCLYSFIFLVIYFCMLLVINIFTVSHLAQLPILCKAYNKTTRFLTFYFTHKTVQVKKFHLSSSFVASSSCA